MTPVDKLGTSDEASSEQVSGPHICKHVKLANAHPKEVRFLSPSPLKTLPMLLEGNCEEQCETRCNHNRLS